MSRYSSNRFSENRYSTEAGAPPVEWGTLYSGTIYYASEPSEPETVHVSGVELSLSAGPAGSVGVGEWYWSGSELFVNVGAAFYVGDISITYVDSSAPVITSFTPTYAQIGDEVEITGSNLTGVVSVLFGSVEAVSFSVVSDITITVTVPVGAVSGVITVVKPEGSDTSNTSFMVASELSPVITAFSPGSGRAGTQVSILGSYFTGAYQVTFGGVPAASFTILSDHQIVARVSDEAVTGAVAVATAVGLGESSVDFTFEEWAPTPSAPPGDRLLAPFRAYVGGGGVLTFIADAPGQAVHWELVSYDPATETEGAALGRLMFEWTTADKSSRATNGYFAPAVDPGDGRYDRVKVTCNA